MCLVITGVGGLIVTYAVGYMAHENDASYARFFSYMDVFIFSMLLLVLAGNFVFLIVGWALVGLSSYFLIGFYYCRRSAVLAARKAFVMNVIGDVGMILGTFVVFFQFHAATYEAVFKRIPKSDTAMLELAAFLFLVGAVAKSAQLPLHTWLPDAMEGPTPVSALIHAATMVTAGVYLVGRLHPIYDVASGASHGGDHRRRDRALRGVDRDRAGRHQAGARVLDDEPDRLHVPCGRRRRLRGRLLPPFEPRLLQGPPVHERRQRHPRDGRRAGHAPFRRALATASAHFGLLPHRIAGACRRHPAGRLLLQGADPRRRLLEDRDPVTIWLWVIGFATAILTGFYTGRMWWISFWGSPSPTRPVADPHEAPYVMLVPVLVLAALTVAGGLLQTRTVLDVGTSSRRGLSGPGGRQDRLAGERP